MVTPFVNQNVSFCICEPSVTPFDFACIRTNATRPRAVMTIAEITEMIIALVVVMVV